MNSKIKIGRKLLMAAACLVGFAAQAATYNDSDIYLKLDGFEGEATDSKHDKWIDVLSFTHGSAQSVQTGSPDVSGRGIFEPFTFKHVVDKATPKLQESCMKGNYIVKATLDYCRLLAGKQVVVYSVTLEGLKIVKAHVEVEELADGKVRLVETVDVLVNKTIWKAVSIGPDNSVGGTVEASYDQSKKQ